MIMHVKSFSIAESKGIHCSIYYEQGVYRAEIIRYNRLDAVLHNSSKEKLIKEAIELFNFQ